MSIHPGIPTTSSQFPYNHPLAASPPVIPWLLFPSLLLPPAPPSSGSSVGSSVGSLALVIPPLFAHNFQAFILLLGQKQARFVLWALPTQAPGACCSLRHASPLRTCAHSSPPPTFPQKSHRPVRTPLFTHHISVLLAGVG